MRENDFIVSKTDLKGAHYLRQRIFIEFSGYSEAELLGAQHNIIRHPDMPRGVFKFLWDNIAAGNEVFAYVKEHGEGRRLLGLRQRHAGLRRGPATSSATSPCGGHQKRSALPVIEGLYKAMLGPRPRQAPRMPAMLHWRCWSACSTKGLSYEELIHAL